MKWFLQVLNNYAKFDGRARRTEFWMFNLVALGFSIIAQVMDWMLGTVFIISSLYSAFLLVPSLAVTVRRLQDTDRCWANIFWAFLPVAGWVILIIYCVTEGGRGSNKYGPDPKA